MQGAGRQHAGSARGQLYQIVGTAIGDRQKRLVDGENQDRAPVMRLERLVIVEVGHPCAAVVAQRPCPAASLAELPGDAGQERGGGYIAPRLGDLETDQLLEGEVLEQGNDIGKGLMEGRDVGVGRFLETSVQPVEQRM